MTRFKVGMKVIAIEDHNGFRKGSIFIIKNISKCSCGIEILDIGVLLNDSNLICCYCHSNITPDDGVWWFYSRRFAPLEDSFSPVTYKEIAKEVVFGANQKPLNMIKLSDIKVGDKVERIVGGEIHITMEVSSVNVDEIVLFIDEPTHGHIDWRFNRKTGAEIDDSLDWDGKTVTGSFILAEDIDASNIRLLSAAEIIETKLRKLNELKNGNKI